MLFTIKKLTIENVKKKIDLLLKEARFETFLFEYIPSKKSLYCFDSLVKKGNSIFLVKVFPNIDNLNKNIIKAIKKLSLLLKSKPLLIGLKNRYHLLVRVGLGRRSADLRRFDPRRWILGDPAVSDAKPEKPA